MSASVVSRPPASTADSDDEIEREPPPAYTASAAQSSAQTLESGPSRPFQDTPSQQPFRPPSHAAPSSSSQHRVDPEEAWAQTYGRPSIDGGSGGSGLFSPYPPQAPLPGHPRPPLAHHASSSSSAPSGYAPTTTPTPGQPLLHEGKLLVFSESAHNGRVASHSVCSKCADTGYKGYGYETSRPCKTCWKRYGRPYPGALRIAVTSPEGKGSLALQEPLPRRPVAPPAPSPQPPMRPISGGYLGAHYQQHHYGPPALMMGGPWAPPPLIQPGYHMPPPGALVVRPGDPRIGGQLCQACGGDGLVAGGFLMLDEVQCDYCRGSGRVFF